MSPQWLLSDNGAVLNPSGPGVLGQLVAYVPSLGVEPITGKPYKPTTQGRNERFHQTLFRYLDKQPLAETLEQLQEQVDAFDVIYNTERPHQGLPGRITQALSWAASPVVETPRPLPQPAVPVGDAGRRMTRIGDNGTVYARGAKFQASRTPDRPDRLPARGRRPPGLRPRGRPPGRISVAEAGNQIRRQRPTPRAARTTHTPGPSEMS